MIRPDFVIEYDSGQDTLTIVFDVVNISSIGQKTIASGFGTYPIQTEFYDISSNVTFTNVSGLTFTSPFAHAWSVFINKSLEAANPSLTGILTDSGLDISFDFSSLSQVHVRLKIIDIRAQIGPGWVEQPE